MPDPASAPSAGHAGGSRPMAKPSQQESDDRDEVYTSGEASDELDYSNETGSEEASEGTRMEEDFAMEHILENGRRYANATCLFPDDDAEETRLAIVHQIYLDLLHGELTISRVPEDVKRILDVGSGAGDWVIAIGEAYPNAHVVATDITAYHSLNAPPNVEFRIEDASQDWSYDEPFDFIHMRDMMAALPDFIHVYEQVARNLTSNGTFEFMTVGYVQLTHNFEGSATEAWIGNMGKALASAGLHGWTDYKDKRSIEKAGLRVMKKAHFRAQLGEWESDPATRRRGRMALVAGCESIEACSLRAFTKYLGWTAEEARASIDAVNAELMDPANEPYLDVDCLVAKRLPFDV